MYLQSLATYISFEAFAQLLENLNVLYLSYRFAWDGMRGKWRWRMNEREKCIFKRTFGNDVIFVLKVPFFALETLTRVQRRQAAR